MVRSDARLFDRQTGRQKKRRRGVD